MDNNFLEDQKKLAHFINFHSHPHSSTYNTIDGIITSFDIKDDIKKVIKLLRTDCVFLKYNKDTDPKVFLENLINALSEEKVIFIFSTTLNLDPIVFDQLSHFREKNEFNVVFGNKDLANIKINTKAKLFLVVSSFSDNSNRIYEITDHVLDLEGKNR